MTVSLSRRRERREAGRVTRRAGAQRRTAQPLTRLDCGGYPGFFLWSGLISNNEGEACTWYVGTCLLLVRTCGVWSKESATTCGVWSKGTCGVWSCKTHQNHRILWKSRLRRSRQWPSSAPALSGSMSRLCVPLAERDARPEVAPHRASSSPICDGTATGGDRAVSNHVSHQQHIHKFLEVPP